ncbi:MAG: FKBP-type peptidyl-prolyl cis-trans isomerase [bacterium]
MAKAQKGDTVKIYYTGRLENGKTFGTKKEGGPIRFKLGEGRMIKGFEEAVMGMEAGESKTVMVPKDEAYGPYIEGMDMVLDRSKLPLNIKPKVGQRLYLGQNDGKRIEMWVTEVTQSSVKLNGNHPLAGEDITFNIHLEEIV